ncbi:glutamate-cysteine ligase family protein [Actinoplanes sp. GCM10030250]|uniref:glutamate-cysteine ligase family protein n=1 Tax=Actinoplanes sp. GCM10030250 TaxID=3273376 RepID=UPI003621745D
MGSADRVLRRTSEAIEHISGICFKTGPPRLIGAELEWTTHHATDGSAYLRPDQLATALGEHAPLSLGNPHPVPLPSGGTVTVEPGGQVEISSAPARSLSDLHAAVSADHATLTELLARSGIVLGERGIDPYRSPRRILETPRYAAMERAFDAPGRTMMGSTAGLQVCLDGSATQRFAALNEWGPALLALFANSRFHAGRDTGWASARMATWFGIDQRRSGPVPLTGDTGEAWARYALDAPLLCVRRDDGRWDAPPGTTFADWMAAGGMERRRLGPGRLVARRIGGRRGTPRSGDPVGRPPTVADLDYHLGTLFPPVRPRGYLEVRYLDTQPGAEWIAPLAVIATLLSDDSLTDCARDVAAPSAGRWHAAARRGLADHTVRISATGLADLACRHLERTGLPPAVRDTVTDIVSRRLYPAVSGRLMKTA